MREQAFGTGEEDADLGASPIETMGARYGIGSVTLAQTGRGDHNQQVVNYLMPPYHGRNGSNERVDPSIVQTPLGGLMPGPNAIAPAVYLGSGQFLHEPDEDGGFGSGVWDAWPEGAPVPIR